MLLINKQVLTFQTSIQLSAWFVDNFIVFIKRSRIFSIIAPHKMFMLRFTERFEVLINV